jgi:hypothetical protein
MLVSEMRMNTFQTSSLNELIGILVTQHTQRINNMNNAANGNSPQEQYISESEFEELNEDLYDP